LKKKMRVTGIYIDKGGTAQLDFLIEGKGRGYPELAKSPEEEEKETVGLRWRVRDRARKALPKKKIFKSIMSHRIGSDHKSHQTSGR